MLLEIHMPLQAKSRLLECLNLSAVYLEYGCGGSTIAAINTPSISKVISVDTSLKWIQDIITACDEEVLDKLLISHVDVGECKSWGRPKSESHIKNWKNYIYKPWAIARHNKLQPNLVLIDGRFRISSFFASMLFSLPETIILFDDYANRPNYHIVEEFIKPICYHGRLAEFRTPPYIDNSFVISLFDNLYNTD